MRYALSNSAGMQRVLFKCIATVATDDASYACPEDVGENGKVIKRHRIQTAVAGHNSNTLARIPAKGEPTVTGQRSQTHSSRIDLPVVQAQKRGTPDEHARTLCLHPFRSGLL